MRYKNKVDILLFQICQRIEKGWSVVHKPGEGSYITKSDQWASFNDVKDMEEKASWIKEQGLGGASLFMLIHDDWQNSCGCGHFPLLTAINHIFHSKSNETFFEQCAISKVS